MSLNITEMKQKRDVIKAKLEDLENNFQDFEDALHSKKEGYLFTEFYRHGRELIDYLTDKKIEELFK